MATLNVSTIGDYLREQRHTAQLSVRQLAAQAGVSNPYLSQIERGLRKPSAEVLQQLARALQISAEALYVRAGLLDGPVGDHSVEIAVLGDPELSELQKRALLDLYASFRDRDAAVAPKPSRKSPATKTTATKTTATKRTTTPKEN